MDKSLSLKAKGLLCQLLSLPDNWNFSETGLTKVVSDGRDSIRSAIKELEGAGYLHRERIREKGKMGKMIYHIYETPFKPIEKEDGTFDYGTVPQEYYYDWMND